MVHPQLRHCHGQGGNRNFAVRPARSTYANARRCRGKACGVSNQRNGRKAELGRGGGGAGKHEGGWANGSGWKWGCRRHAVQNVRSTNRNRQQSPLPATTASKRLFAFKRPPLRLRAPVKRRGVMRVCGMNHRRQVNQWVWSELPRPPTHDPTSSASWGSKRGEFTSRVRARRR